MSFTVFSMLGKDRLMNVAVLLETRLSGTKAICAKIYLYSTVMYVCTFLT